MVRQEPAKLLSPSSNLGVAFFLKGDYVGKIFRISDNPVSVIGKALESITVPKPKITYIKIPKQNQSDKFVSKEKTHSSNPFVKMRNGIGKLMSHFSKKKV